LLLIYPLMPFSATVNDPEAGLAVIRRYLIAPFAIGLVLFSRLCEQGRPGRFFCLALAVLAAVTAWPGGSGNSPVVAVAAGVAAMALWTQRQRLKAFRPLKAQPLLDAALLCLSLVLLAAWAPRKQEKTNANLYAFAGQECAGAAALKALEDLPPGSSLAVFGEFAYQYYPAFGRKLELRPAVVEGDGTLYQPLHLRWRQGQGSLWDHAQQESDLTHLVENLMASGVDYVLVTKWGGGAWPRQQAVLEEQLPASSPEAKPMYTDACSAIWKLPASGRGRAVGRRGASQ
jgi:hypothetical protein